MNVHCMYSYFVSFFLLTVSSLSFGNNPPWSVPDTVEGTWKTFDYISGNPETVVKIWSEHDTLYGMITDIIDPKRGSNPICDQCEGSFNGVSLNNLKIIWGCVKRNGRWVKGKMLDISDGKIYRCEIELHESGELSVFAHVNRFFKIGRTYRWVRLQ